MAAVNIKAFRGAVPRIGSRLLQPNQAEVMAKHKAMVTWRVGSLGG